MQKDYFASGYLALSELRQLAHWASTQARKSRLGRESGASSQKPVRLYSDCCILTPISDRASRFELIPDRDILLAFHDFADMSNLPVGLFAIGFRYWSCRH